MKFAAGHQYGMDIGLATGFRHRWLRLWSHLSRRTAQTAAAGARTRQTHGKVLPAKLPSQQPTPMAAGYLAQQHQLLTAVNAYVPVVAARAMHFAVADAATGLNHPLRLLLCFAPLAWRYADLGAEGAGKRRLTAVAHGIGHLQQ